MSFPTPRDMVRWLCAAAEIQGDIVPGSRRVLLSPVLVLLAVKAASAAELFARFRQDGVLTLRSSTSHEVLGRISPGLDGPNWTGF